MERFDQLLTKYDRTQKQYLINGFRVNFIGELTSFESPYIKTFTQNLEILFSKLSKELDVGRIAGSGPFHTATSPSFRTPPVGIVPKKIPNEFRLIHHLSYPKGLSVNDSGRLRFSTTDGFTLIVASWVIRAGWREFKDLYWNLKPANSSWIHIFDAFSLKRVTYEFKDQIDTLNRECKEFRDQFLEHLNLSCLVMTNAKPDLCKFWVCERENVTVPTPLYSLPEIEFCKARSQASFRKDSQFAVKRSVTLRELQSLIGPLNFCCSVVTPGHAFLRCIDLTAGVTCPHHHIRRLNT